MIERDAPENMLAPNNIYRADDGSMAGIVHRVIFLETRIEFLERADGKSIPLIQQIEYLFLL